MARKTDTIDQSPAVNDAYTGMLAISLLALVVGCVLLFLDYSAHSAAPPKLTKAPPPPAGVAPVIPAPQAPAGDPTGQPPPMGMPPMGMPPMGMPPGMPPMAPGNATPPPVVP